MIQKKRPNFLIIGAMKSATTSLYTYLKQHPDIFMPSIKEPMFFNNLNTNQHIVLEGRNKKKITSFKKYYDLFQSVKNEIAIGEASPGYLYNKDCASLIKEHLKNIKIIAVLRQPISRAYSNYLHARRSGKEPIDNFEEAINNERARIQKNWSPLYHYLNQGYYYKHLQRYYQLFPKENIKIILFEELTKNTDESIKDILHFLQVDNEIPIQTNKKTNISGVPKGILGWIIMKFRYYNLVPNIEFSKYLPKFIVNIILYLIYSKPEKIDKKQIKKLTNKYYKEDILKLEKLISKDLSQWLK